MSMLAQGRRKQKISTNPNGHLFSSEQNHIGQKILTQMGWEKGKGLGANEQGEKDPIKVRQNTESRGLGFKRADADKWIAHQDDFNSLLANLNEPSDDSPQPDAEQETAKSSVQSLEAKSKSSRSRVHYMKFTKGKDLSKHSDKDLACILGPNRSQNITPVGSVVNSTVASAANSDDSNGLADQGDSSDPFLSDTLHVTSTLSLHEYFAAKMASKKAHGSNSSLVGLVTATSSPDTTAEDNEVVTKPSFFIGDTVEQEDDCDVEQTTSSSKSKTSKRNSPREYGGDIEEKSEEGLVSSSEMKVKKKKKKKKGRNEEADIHESGGKTKPKPADDTMKFVSEPNSEEDAQPVSYSDQSKKKPKKRKHMEENTSPPLESETTPNLSPSKHGKMRKSKSDSLLLELGHSNDQVEEGEGGDSRDSKHKKKKSKKHKSKEL